MVKPPVTSPYIRIHIIWAPKKKKKKRKPWLLSPCPKKGGEEKKEKKINLLSGEKDASTGQITNYSR